MGTGRARAGHDVILVGARVAGAATALLLARQGVRVLVVDRAGFPSDTLSSHQVQVPGVALLHRWGLLERLRTGGTPPVRRVRFDPGPVVLEGGFPAYDGVDELFSPRRTVLDTLLLEAAREAGAEVRERFRVTELTWSEGRVTGVRGQERGGPPVTAAARLVIGADGKRSFVAEAVGATPYRTHPALAFASYGYWAGLPLGVGRGELYQRPGRAVAVFPTDAGLTMVYAAAPLAQFPAARSDLTGHFLATLDRCGDLGDRVRAGTRAERLRTAPDQPNTFRVPHGPGWALVGDAGVVMDSVSAQGITNALRDAELLAETAGAALRDGGEEDLDAALARHQRRRDAMIGDMYDFTVRLAALPVQGARERALYAALAGPGRQDEVDRFLGVFGGIVPLSTYFAPRNLARTLGVRGFASLAASPFHRGNGGGVRAGAR